MSFIDNIGLLDRFYYVSFDTPTILTVLEIHDDDYFTFMMDNCPFGFKSKVKYFNDCLYIGTTSLIRY